MVSTAVLGPSDLRSIGGLPLGVYNYNPQFLQRWAKARAQVALGIGSARIAVISDSTGAGFGAGAGGTQGSNNARVVSWPTRLAAKLTAAGYPANVDSMWGDANAGPNFTVYDPRWATGTGWSPLASSTVLGGKILQHVAGASGVASFTPVGSVKYFKLYCVGGAGRGSMTLDIDGAGATVVDTSALGSYASTTIAAGAAGTHTLNITSSDLILLCSVEAYSDAAAVRVLNMGFAGSTTATWNIGGLQYAPVPALGTQAPNLTILALGINDWGTPGIPLATYTTNILALASAAKAVGDLIVVGPYNTSGTSEATQSTYRAAARAAAEANGGVYFDAAEWFGAFAQMNSNGLMFDGAHAKAELYDMFASAVLRIVV